MKPRTRHLLRCWLPPLGYCLLIFIASSGPSAPGLDHFPHQDKLLHGLAYAVMGALFYHALKHAAAPTFSRRAFFFSIFLATLYGLSDEVHQMFVPGRTADGGDLAADFLGSLLGVWCYRRWGPALRRQTLRFPD